MDQSTAVKIASTMPRAETSATAIFVKSFLADPLGVASIVPSSVQTVHRMLAPIAWRRVRTFVEYGPGVGTFTTAVLNRLPTYGRLIAIDTNAAFIDHLGHSIRDPRFEAVRGSAADVRTILADLRETGADCVLSGVPFSALGPRTGETIVRESARIMRPGACFMAYQIKADIEGPLRRHFTTVERATQWWNVPPVRLWWAEGPEGRPT